MTYVALHFVLVALFAKIDILINPMRKFVTMVTYMPVSGSFGLVWPLGWLSALQRPLTLMKQLN